MKKSAVLLAIFFVFSGCNNAEKSNFKLYKNTDAGIEFQYPPSLGQPVETKEGEKLLSIRFGDAFEFRPVEESYIIYNCNNEILNTQYEKCETIFINNHKYIIKDFVGPDITKDVQFQTKNATWGLYSGDYNYFGTLMNVVKTIKYLE